MTDEQELEQEIRRAQAVRTLQKRARAQARTSSSPTVQKKHTPRTTIKFGITNQAQTLLVKSLHAEEFVEELCTVLLHSRVTNVAISLNDAGTCFIVSLRHRGARWQDHFYIPVACMTDAAFDPKGTTHEILDMHRNANDISFFIKIAGCG
jgi:hypothetical protein